MAPSASSRTDTAGSWRWNLLAQRWVLVAPLRAERTHDHREPDQPCPFCPGAEAQTPPEIARVGDPWQVRVFPNRYAALSPVTVVWTDGLPTDPSPYETAAEPGFGHSEVVVLSPDHTRDWSQLSDAAVRAAAQMLCERIVDLGERPHVRAVLGFVNHGRAAGASREHPHAQVMATPMIPPELVAEARSTSGAGCVLCGLDQDDPDLRVLERESVLAVCPFWAEWDDEVLVVPRRHSPTARPREEPLDRGTVAEAGTAVRDILAALARLRGRDLAYNVIWHVGPDGGRSDFHWHVHLRPRRDAHAGFEQGTGLRINSVAPTVSAGHLRNALRRAV